MNTSNCIETATTVVFLSPQAFLDACGGLIDLVVCNNTRNHFPIHYTFTNDSSKTLQNKTIHFVLNHHNVVAGESKHCVLQPNPASDPVDAGNEAAAVTQIYELIHDKMRAFSNVLFPNMYVEYPAVNKIIYPFRQTIEKLLELSKKLGKFALRVGAGWVLPETGSAAGFEKFLANVKKERDVVCDYNTCLEPEDPKGVPLWNGEKGKVGFYMNFCGYKFKPNYQGYKPSNLKRKRVETTLVAKEPEIVPEVNSVYHKELQPIEIKVEP